ncbi:MAG: alanine--tRNA ligase [Candidatus Nanopelagicales bacterium]
MESAEIRKRFLSYFERNGHTVVPSASLLLDDPTLLFVNAGMVPFKPYFLGEAVPPYPRAASVQKCVRTLDIEEVGKTTRHASFFQMCGNFSFGDYFKEAAIPFAWNLLTGAQADGGFGFDGDRLWVTVLGDDQEAIDIWLKTGVPRERIQSRGFADNYWSMGVPGPGGPCSEIYFDRGPQYGREGGPEADEDRYLEVWNLVFMQDELSTVRSKIDFDIAGSLPQKNIDTGMGLERMAALLQGVENIYEIDTTKLILDRASALTGVKYGADEKSDVRLRVIADHARTCAFLIADGVLPSNEGRGYVLRRIMRRVVRNMRILGAMDPTMAELIDVSVQSMSPQYPELLGAHSRLRTVSEAEEAAFISTLKQGTQIFDLAVADAKAQTAGTPTLSGASTFALHDTFGFPFDLTLEMAAEHGVHVDEDGFRRLMKEQRDRAKADARVRKAGFTSPTVYRDVMERIGTTTFTGYDEVVSESTIGGIVAAGLAVQSAKVGDTVEIIMSRTPFYAESGGQLGDHGIIEAAGGARIDVFDVQSPVPGMFVHRATIVDGEVTLGEQAVGRVDLERRNAISRAHTATHMIHKAFREILGDTATQMGSENSPGRLRFDFPSANAVPDAVMNDVESRVNTLLLNDLPVTAEYMSQDAARKLGAMALFGEKYGDTVRVVSVGDWTRELCGGTHTKSSGNLGLVKFLSEGSIGAGVRRVEALVGSDAYRFLAREHLLVNQLAEMIKSRPEELPERIDAMLQRLKDVERELDKVRAAALRAQLDQLVRTDQVGAVVVKRVVLPEGTPSGELRNLVMELRGQIPESHQGVVVGFGSEPGKVALVIAANAAAIAAGHGAGALLQRVAPVIGGKGGGKPDLAQGGGTEVSAIPAAMLEFDRALAH